MGINGYLAVLSISKQIKFAQGQKVSIWQHLKGKCQA